MCKWTKPGVLVLIFCIVISVAAQETTEAVDPDYCVDYAVKDWSLPQTLGEALSLRDALDELIRKCGGEALFADDAVASEVETFDADCDIPRTMYVISRVPRINVRSGPSTRSSIVSTLARGAAVDVFAVVEGERFMDSAFWYRIQIGGEDVYIHSKLLGKTKPAPLAIPAPDPQGQEEQEQQQQQQQESQQQPQQQQVVQQPQQRQVVQQPQQQQQVVQQPQQQQQVVQQPQQQQVVQQPQQQQQVVQQPQPQQQVVQQPQQQQQVVQQQESQENEPTENNVVFSGVSETPDWSHDG